MAGGGSNERMLSVGRGLATLPMVACLSAYHLAALLFPPTLRCLYFARDDPAGGVEMAALTARAQTAGIEALKVSPTLGDFHDDLRRLDIDCLRVTLRVQLAPEDLPQFMSGDRSHAGSRLIALR